MDRLMVAVYLALLVVLLGLLVLGAIRSLRLLRSVIHGETVLSGPEALVAVVAVVFLGLLIVGAAVGLVTLAISA